MSDFFMNKSSDDWNKLKHLVDLSAENARLNAEVERLTSEVSYDNRVQLHVDKLAGEFTQAENARLKAEVERLRKHRNTLIQLLDKAIEDLNAAKEGKQS